ncbi:MAG TPA: FKBP-type peptidyl-prolyl cis-trans isomerase [Solirubrobacterales bacterium]|nr:FKBP-type peptidyl-prolyl cis-trans isomerase [Solirubrobacterales bacterium]
MAETTNVANAEGPGPAIKLPAGPPPKKLVVKNLRKGTGAEAKVGYEATIRYVGARWNGEIYSNSWTYELAPGFVLGAGELTMPGLDKGIQGMRVGGQREIILPPNARFEPGTGHGANPDEETLIYIVDLLKVRPRFEKYEILKHKECVLSHPKGYEGCPSRPPLH